MQAVSDVLECLGWADVFEILVSVSRLLWRGEMHAVSDVSGVSDMMPRILTFLVPRMEWCVLDELLFGALDGMVCLG